MSDEAAFVRAIHEAPADDAPRLVYADWLDERDDPRGAFLRDECQAAAEFRAGKPAAAKKLRESADAVGFAWALSVARPPVGVCSAHRFVGSGRLLTPADLDAAEQKSGTTFPPDYRAFLLLHNGGQPSPNQFAYADSDDGPEAVGIFHPVNPRKGVQSVLENYGGHADDPDLEDLFDSLLAIGMPRSDEDCIALSVEDGAVFYVPYIEGIREPTRVADSFAEFLATLTDRRADWVRMAEDGDAAGMGAWLDAGGDPFARDPVNDFTPLDYAICYQRVDVVKAILDRKPKFTGTRAANVRDLIQQYPHAAIRKLVEAYLVK